MVMEFDLGEGKMKAKVFKSIKSILADVKNALFSDLPDDVVLPLLLNALGGRAEEEILFRAYQEFDDARTKYTIWLLAMHNILAVHPKNGDFEFSLKHSVEAKEAQEQLKQYKRKQLAKIKEK